MLAGVAQGGLISNALFSLYVIDKPPPLHHVELALYADDTAIITTFRKPTLLVSYLESYLTTFNGARVNGESPFKSLRPPQ